MKLQKRRDITPNCHLNATELIWTNIKVKVARQNTAITLNGTEKLTKEGTEQVMLDHWRQAVLHMQITEEAREIDELSEDTVDEMIISIGNNFSSNSHWNAKSVSPRQ
jgi:hypothetical protein